MEKTAGPQINEQLWQEYRAMLYRFILGRVSDATAAEDIVQDVLAKAYHRLDTLKDGDKIAAWLYQITRNAIADYYRTLKPAEELDELHIVQETNVGEDVEKNLAHCIMPFIKQLPDHYRQAVLLSEIEGLTQKQVASKQGLTLSGAKSRVQRGRQMLKKMFLDCCQLQLDYQGTVINYEPNRVCDQC